MSRYFLSPQKRDRLKMWALRLAYLKEENPSSSQQAGPKKFVPGGINVVGYLHGELGVGEAARSTIAAAQAAGLQVSAIDFRTGCLARMQHSLRGIRNQGPLYETSIFHVNADQVPVMASHFGRSFFQGHLNIGFWFWELPIFPDKWMNSFLPFQEIWVASTFCLDAIAQKSPVPVRRIPLCIEPEVPADIDRRTFKLPEDKFLFLAMGDFLSVPERKNLMGAVEAFRRAFGKNPSGARLILKILNPNARSDMMATLASYASDDSSIIIIEDYKSRVELNGLINCCDCLVSLHRSEGFGLPIAEAMYMAKPVIATGWSSNMDFMNLSNSFPVKYKLVQLEQDYGPYEKGNFWADPDLDHAADLMRRVCADPDLGREIGNNAAQSVRQDLSPEAVGRLIKRRINDTRNVH
jgi:glycosyltransferase involved in cell wall biosynthesis